MERIKMRENVVKVQYSSNGECRYEIVDRKDGTYQVWVEKKIYDDYVDKDWFGWADIPDGAHIVDSIERAIAVGNEGIVALKFL